MYAKSQKIGKPNYLSLGCKKTIRLRKRMARIGYGYIYLKENET
jgi:hypothetical protein